MNKPYESQYKLSQLRLHIYLQQTGVRELQNDCEHALNRMVKSLYGPLN